jgi:hypothetical protein
MLLPMTEQKALYYYSSYMALKAHKCYPLPYGLLVLSANLKYGKDFGPANGQPVLLYAIERRAGRKRKERDQEIKKPEPSQSSQ